MRRNVARENGRRCSPWCMAWYIVFHAATSILM
jgi:hypothetical protein